MIPSPKNLKPGVSVVVPCYNEEGAVRETVEAVANVLNKAASDEASPFESEMIFVNDGSGDRTLEILQELTKNNPRLRVVDNGTNCGYGASLKRGIAQACYEKIVITDADGTYPNERIPEIARELDNYDMVIGARTGKNVHIPLLRRPAKWALLQYARMMTGADIRDINSGLRTMWTRHVHQFWFMLPDAFSFTSTITLAMHMNRMRVKYISIDYARRVGKSSIKPIRDTLRFFSLVLRTVMYFRPLQILGSISLFLIFSAIATGILGRIYLDQVPDVATTSLFSTGIIFLGLGLIGDLINARRNR
jgi:glycosyltransferase involved in cell wall biosynthesis